MWPIIIQDEPYTILYIHGLAQNCRNSIATALELLQSCTKSYIYNGIDPFFVLAASSIYPKDGKALTDVAFAERGPQCLRLNLVTVQSTVKSRPGGTLRFLYVWRKS